MKKHWQIYKTFFKNSVSYFVQYRSDTWFSLFLTVIWIAMMFLFISVLFTHTDSIAGWSKEGVYLLTLFWTITDELATIFFQGNVMSIPDTVTDGKLDIYLTKPANKLFLATLNHINIKGIFRLLLEIAVTVFVISQLPENISLASGIMGIILLLFGVIAIFSTLLVINTLSFWFLRIGNINDLWFSMFDLAKYPLNVLPKTIRIIFLTALPIAFTAYTPTLTFLGNSSYQLIVYSLIFVTTLFILAILFWRFALKRYSSASS